VLAAEAVVRQAAEEALAQLAGRAVMLAAGGSLLSCFAVLPDPRDPRGIRHSLPCLLVLVTAALLSGKTLLEDVTAWIAHAGPQVLAAAGVGTDGVGTDGVGRDLACSEVIARMSRECGGAIASKFGRGPVVI